MSFIILTSIMMNNNYTNFWNDIQVNNSVDDEFVKPKVDHIALAGYRGIYCKLCQYRN